MRKKKLVFLALIPVVIGFVIIYFYFFRKPLYLWEMESNGKTIYMLGTVHVFKQELYQEIDPKIIDAFDKSDILLCESGDSKTKIWMLPIGDSLHNYISKEYYQKLNELLEEKELYIDGYSSYRPYYFLYRMISISASRHGYDEYIRDGIDMFFANKFYSKNIHHNWNYYALEKQNYFADYLEEYFSAEELGYFIYAEVKNYLEKGSSKKKICESLMKNWLGGSVEGYLDELWMFTKTRKDSDTTINKDLEENISAKLKLIHEKRNFHMADTIEEFIKKDVYNTIFVMAGVAHFIRENNIIDILEKRGYKIKRIHKTIFFYYRKEDKANHENYDIKNH